MTRSNPIPTRRAIAWCGLLALAGCGESPSPEGFARYVPDPAKARAAIVATLDDWKAGRVGKAASPSIQVVDSLRGGGRPLEGFEILGELAADGSRCFGVRLNLGGPPEERVERYLVIGIDPLV